MKGLEALKDFCNNVGIDPSYPQPYKKKIQKQIINDIDTIEKELKAKEQLEKENKYLDEGYTCIVEEK